MLSQQLILGSVYRLKFKGVFERHGVCSTAGFTCLHKGEGTFRLDQIASFDDVQKAGVKLYDNFFAPLDISEDDYRQYFSGKPDDQYKTEFAVKTVPTTTITQDVTTDPETKLTKVISHQVVTEKECFTETGRSILTKHLKDNVCYAEYPIYKFTDVIDEDDVLYVPELTLDGFPEIAINEYKNLHLVFHLGLFDRPELLDPMLLAIRERMSVYGIMPKHVKLYSTGSKWMNPDEYEKIKSLRVPADINTIPETAEFDPLVPTETNPGYRGKHVIVNGLLKEIVETVQAGKEADQVAFNALKSKTINIDSKNYFLADVKPSEHFKTNTTYYEVIDESTSTYRVLNGVDECPIGDEIMRFEAHAYDPVADKGKTLYKKVFDDSHYILLGKDEYRDGNRAWGQIAGRTWDDDSFYYWVKTIETVDDVSTVTWSRATQSDIEDDNKPLYTKLPAAYQQFTPAAAGDLCFILVSRTGTAGTGKFKYENYTSVNALSLLGQKFTYKTESGGEKTLTVTLADLIDISSNEQDTVDLTVNYGKKEQATYVADIQYYYKRTVSETATVASGTFQEGVTYYTRSGSGTATSPYVYTKATVTAGQPIPASPTYYLYEAVIVYVPITITSEDEFDTAKTTYKTLYTDDFTKLDPTEAQLRRWHTWAGRRFRYVTTLDPTVVEEEAEYKADASYFYRDYVGSTKYIPLSITSQTELDTALEQYPGGIYTGEPVTLESSIPDEPNGRLSGFSGTIMGQNGVIARELYFLNDEHQRRNYYMQYMLLKHEYDLLQHKCAELEDHLIKLSNG